RWSPRSAAQRRGASSAGEILVAGGIHEALLSSLPEPCAHEHTPPGVGAEAPSLRCLYAHGFRRRGPPGARSGVVPARPRPGDRDLSVARDGAVPLLLEGRLARLRPSSGATWTPRR